MSSPINVAFSVLVGTPLIIPCNRWAPPHYSLQVTSGTGTLLLEGTNQKLNQGETAVWFGLDDEGGTAITALGQGGTQVAKIPVEAVRLTATTATTTGNFVQQGQTD
jgi:hypothetical protein